MDKTTQSKQALKKIEQNLSLTRITRTLYFFIAFYFASIIVFDSGNLITRDAVVNRASAAFVLLILNTLAWYVAAEKVQRAKPVSVYVITLVLIGFAGFTTYWERGMASTSTILYVLPLLIIATQKNRHALLATAALSAGTYAYAAVRYFNDFFNEGFRIQLWGNLVLIVGSIFTATWLIMILAGLRKDSH